MVNYWSKFNQFLFPARCLLCDAPSSQHHGLCNACTVSLPWLKHSCPRCALPLAFMAPSTFLCGNCQNRLPAFDQCLSLFYYHYPVDKLITQLKFQHKLLYARLFALLLTEHIRQKYQHQALPDLIIPVPLHRKRLRERGFNQAQEIARLCASNLNIPLHSNHCWRHKHTAHQLGLSAPQRRRNIKNAFSCRSFVTGTSVALIDDVMTTGTTLNELSACMKRAGCGEIHLWCIARAHY